MSSFSDQIRPIIKSFPSVKLAYLFGSRARGKAGPLSDYDFAFYLDEKSEKKRFDIRLKLMAALSSALQTEAVDVVILNDTESPELKYFIVKEGIMLHEVEPFKVLIEPRILNEYFDFHESLLYYGLTKRPSRSEAKPLMRP